MSLTCLYRDGRRELPPFVQLHLFIFVLLVSAAVSVMLQPHRYAGRMDLVSMSAIALIMFMSLYFIAYNKQPSCASSMSYLPGNPPPPPPSRGWLVISVPAPVVVPMQFTICYGFEASCSAHHRSKT